MKLYHGSNVDISVPELSKSKPYKDFGQGFYFWLIKTKQQKWPSKKLF